ncbi:cell division protein [Lactobacillus taiwanensis]|uniref:cell division protein n=1 Tax=Lactobacillus taiwanensis TaxID=508451 RepID=UPI0025AF3271|nr:cell division protein [Lactobacillus taiwanensis]
MQIRISNRYKDKIIEYVIPILLSIVIATILMLPEFLKHVGIFGNDTIFQLSRFYDASKQIQNHNFSYFQMNYGMGQTGRIINAIYGPFFAYLMGGLLFFAGSWFRYEIILTYVLFLIGGIGFYHLSRKVNVSKVVACVTTTLFLTSGYIFYWIYSNNGNCLGSVFIPYVIIQAIDLINNYKKPFNWILLGVTVAIIAQVHMLSTVMSILLLLPCFIYGLVLSSDKRKMWIDVIKAVILCVFLTANVWGAFLVVYGSNKVSSPLDFSPALTTLNLTTPSDVTMWMGITEGILLLFCIQLIYVLFNFKSSKINTFLTIEGFVFLILSSNLFPWKFVQDHFYVIASYFQFPNRLTAIAYPLLFVAVGITLTRLTTDHGKEIGRLALILVLIITLFNIKGDLNQASKSVAISEQNVDQVTKLRMTDLDVFIGSNPPGNPDYFALQHKMNSWEVEKFVAAHLNYRKGFSKEVLSGGRLKVSWNSKNDTNTSLPIVMYHQSQLELNGKKVDPKLNTIGMPIVKSKQGQNTAILSFKTPTWFIILLYISILGWVVMLVYGVFRLVKIAKK